LIPGQKISMEALGKYLIGARLSELNGQQVILAGGLNPDNIDDAIATVNPYALDVSGGVEISPGVKSSKLMQIFVDKCSLC